MIDDVGWMRRAIEVSRRCPPSDVAFSVGALIVDGDGNEIARGWSRETDPTVHAEESALAKMPAGDPRLASATLYSTLEPCSARKSRPTSCTQHILAAGIPRVVIAWREPSLFVDGEGVEQLTAAGVIVVELPELAAEAKAVNAHLDLEQPARRGVVGCSMTPRTLCRRPPPASAGQPGRDAAQRPHEGVRLAP